MRAAWSLVVVAALLWLGTLLLALAFEGDGSPVGPGLVMLLAIVVTLLARDRLATARKPHDRDRGHSLRAAHKGTCPAAWLRPRRLAPKIG